MQRTKPFLVLCPAYLLASSLPLTAAIGRNLEYEYALAASYLALLLIPLVAFLGPAPAPNPTQESLGDNDGKASYTTEFLWTLVLSPILGLLPGLFTFWSDRCSCSVTGHYFWMLILWYPAWVLAHAAYFAIFRGRKQSIHRGKLFAIWMSVYALLVLLLAAELWFNPQKRTLSLLAGFIHGPIYDDWIVVDGGIVLGRLAHLFAAGFLLSLAGICRRPAKISVTVILATSWLLCAVFSASYPSVSSGRRSLEELLPEKLVGHGFTLHYERKAEPGTPLGITRLFRDAQFHVTELKEVLGSDTLPHVQIFVYPDRTAKKIWFGGGATDVADVWTPSIHITADSWPHPTLRHELVHALASAFGFHGLGFHPNMAFTEGLAVALAPEERALSLNEGAASLLDSGRIRRVEDLFSPAGFFSASGGRAYTVAGSLLAYVIKEQGIDPVKKLYSGKSWDKAFGQSRQTTLEHWRGTVMQSYDKERMALQSEALFRYPGVMHDLCPHSKADLHQPRSNGFYVRMRQPIGWDPEIDYAPWLLSLDPKNLSVRLDIWKAEINKLAEDRFVSEGRLSTWREVLQRAKEWPPKVIEDVEMTLLESDLTRILGDQLGSVKVLQEILAYQTQKQLPETLARQLGARLLVESQLDPTSALEWRRYLAGWRRTAPEPSTIEPWVLTYLRIRRSDSVAPSSETLKGMLTMPIDPLLNQLGPAIYGAFALEWYKVLAQRFMNTGLFEQAASAYQNAAAVAPNGKKELLLEHQRRALFYLKNL